MGNSFDFWEGKKTLIRGSSTNSWNNRGWHQLSKNAKHIFCTSNHDSPYFDNLIWNFCKEPEEKEEKKSLFLLLQTIFLPPSLGQQLRALHQFCYAKSMQKKVRNSWLAGLAPRPVTSAIPFDVLQKKSFISFQLTKERTDWRELHRWTVLLFIFYL